MPCLIKIRVIILWKKQKTNLYDSNLEYITWCIQLKLCNVRNIIENEDII